LNLNLWSDFSAAHGIVAQAIKRAPILTLIVVLLAACQSFLGNESGLLGTIESFLVLGLSCRVVYETWSVITGTERPDPKQDYARLASVWGNSILYGMAVSVGFVFLIVPGIYFAVAASLGLAIACIKKVRAAQAFGESMKLISTRFWESFSYFFPVLFLFGIVASGSLLAQIYGYSLVTGAMHATGVKEDTLMGATAMVTTSADLFTNWALLCVVTMQVRLYKALKEAPEHATQTTV